MRVTLLTKKIRGPIWRFQLISLPQSTQLLLSIVLIKLLFIRILFYIFHELIIIARKTLSR